MTENSAILVDPGIFNKMASSNDSILDILYLFVAGTLQHVLA